MAVEYPVRGHLVVVDDDQAFNHVLSRALGQRGFVVRSVHGLDEALRTLCDPAGAVDQVVVDLNLSGQSGLQLIRPTRAAHPDARIVVLTGYASIPTAVDAIKLGADQYLAKPVDVDTVVRALLEQTDAHAEEPVAQPPSVARIEWEHIQRVLHEHGGNVSATARALGMHRRTLQRKLVKRPALDQVLER